MVDHPLSSATGPPRRVIPQRFARNAVKSVGIGLLALLPALVLPAIYARTLPSADLAAWLYAFSIATYVTAFHLGVAPATSALVSREVEDPRSRAALLLAAAILLTLATLIATSVLLATNLAGGFHAQATASFGEDKFRLVLALAIVGTAATLPLHAWAGYCTGTFEVGRLFPINLLQKATLTAFAIIAALVWHDATAIAWSHLASGLATAAVLAVLVAREILPQRAAALAQLRPRLRSLLNYSMPAALAGIAQLPLAGVHTVIVAREIPTAIVPFAALAPALTLIAGMIWSIMSNLLPEMSAGYQARHRQPTRDRLRRQQRLLVRALCLLAITLIAVQISVLAGLPWFLRWAVTADWASAHLGGLGAYAAALTLRQLTLPLGLAFFSDGKPWIGLVPTWAEALTSIALALMLVPVWGLAGLAFAVLAGVVVNALMSPRLLGLGARVHATRAPGAGGRARSARDTPGIGAQPGLTRPLTFAVLVTIAFIALSLGFGDPDAGVRTIRPQAFSALMLLGGFLLAPAFWWLGVDTVSRRVFVDSLATTVQRIGSPGATTSTPAR